MSSTRTEGGGEAASYRAHLPLEWLLSRQGAIAGAALLIAIALSWRWLVSHGSSMMPMAGSRMGRLAVDPWSADYLGTAFLMWTIMMVAMMLPAAAPMILLHARINRAPTSGQRLAHSLLFTLSYLLVWTAFSGAAAIGQALLLEVGAVTSASLAVGDHVLAAAILLAAALYQFSSVKIACLDHCRSPIQFIMHFGSPGIGGTLKLGLAHGLFCLGCCWVLMLLLFVAGVMNLGWVAVIAAAIFLEKVAPRQWPVSTAIGLALLAAAAGLLFTR